MDDTGSFVAIRPRWTSLRHSALRPWRGHSASTRVGFAAIVTAAAAVLAGCTASGSGVQTQDLTSAPIASFATPTSTTGLATSSAMGASATAPDSSAPVTPAVSPLTATATADPWPANLTPEQQDQARAALAALDGYIQVTNAASADPAAKDWTADIRKFAADPEATQFLESIASMASAKVRQVVAPSYGHPAVTSVAGNRVSIQTCLDQSGISVLDENGDSALEPISSPRVLWTANVYLYDPQYGGWLVSETAPLDPEQPC